MALRLPGLPNPLSPLQDFLSSVARSSGRGAEQAAKEVARYTQLQFGQDPGVLAGIQGHGRLPHPIQNALTNLQIGAAFPEGPVGVPFVGRGARMLEHAMSRHPAYKGQMEDLIPNEVFDADQVRNMMLREHRNTEFGHQTWNDYIDAGLGPHRDRGYPPWSSRATSESEWLNMGSPFPEGPVGLNMPDQMPLPGMYGRDPITRWEMMDDAMQGAKPQPASDFLKAYLRRMRLPGGGY